MAGALWAVAGFSLVVALLALRWAWKLAKDTAHLKREQYYTSSRLKRIPDEIREAVEPVRVHLAKLAAGGGVPLDMILECRWYQNVTTDVAQQILDQEARQSTGKVLFVDVRTPQEYAAKHVVGAKLVPFEELETRYKTDIPETAEKVFLYCMGGERSRSACGFLSRRGYTNLYNIQEGLQGWRGPTEGAGTLNLVQIQPSRNAQREV